MFRRFLPFLIACFLVVLPVTEVVAAPIAQQQSTPTYSGTINTTANVRSGPGTDYTVVEQLRPGQVVTVTGCNSDCSWFQLDSGNWIAAFLVDLQVPATNSSETQDPVPTQPESSPKSEEPLTPGRSAQVVDPEDLELHDPSQAALGIVGQILSYTGLPQNFDLYSANIYNAAALMVNGKRVILYDPQLIADIENITNHDWPAVSILAHEIGHHLAGHTLAKSYDKEFELEADYFSGYILHKMGASLDQAQAVMSLLRDHPNMTDHPPQAERLLEIQSGWEEAARQSGLAAWQPGFPSFEEEVALNLDSGTTPSDSLSILGKLREAQRIQLVQEDAPKVATAIQFEDASHARDWGLGIRALVE